MKIYYYLKKGETINEGDEVEMSSKYNEPAKWVLGNPKNIGGQAPDPQYMSHRKYRREITLDSYMSAISSDQRMKMIERLFEVIEQI